jgi:hypothetical protein
VRTRAPWPARWSTRCASTDIAVRLLADEAAQLGLTEPEVELIGEVDGRRSRRRLRARGRDRRRRHDPAAAEATHAHGTPLLGVNLGHVGFLAESESDDLDFTIDAIVTRRYTAEDRLTIDVAVYQDGELVTSTWALNEASVEKAARSGCSRWWSRSTAARCRGGAATAWSVRPRPAARLQLLARGPSCGRASRRC